MGLTDTSTATGRQKMQFRQRERGHKIVSSPPKIDLSIAHESVCVDQKWSRISVSEAESMFSLKDVLISACYPQLALLRQDICDSVVVLVAICLCTAAPAIRS